MKLQKIKGVYIPFSEEDQQESDKVQDNEVIDADTKRLDKRTLKQNSAMHKYFTMLANTLNNGGLTQTKILKADVGWSAETVKENLWKPIQKALLNKKSTTNLKRDEVTKVYDTLNLALGQKFGISVEFPHIEE